MERALREDFWLVNTPSAARHEGWALDRSHCFTGAAFAEEADGSKEENLAKWLAFLKTTLNL